MVNVNKDIIIYRLIHQLNAAMSFNIRFGFQLPLYSQLQNQTEEQLNELFNK
jgi:hypothetical protein